MMTQRQDGPTPNGGAYSEICYFNDAGDMVDGSEATRCVIRECAADGTLLCETWGVCRDAGKQDALSSQREGTETLPYDLSGKDRRGRRSLR